MLVKKHPDGKLTHNFSYYCHLISQKQMKALKVEPLIGYFPCFVTMLSFLKVHQRSPA